ncbi:Putative oxidoreductase, Fe-S subunit [Rhodovulum sp. PH10]|uniref:hypothetical protein n=1 Tax=Rhodovulum sp. PH10 TaxID=1187851 RepID=UPI00027C29A5|nr:hypothetical protein [Rhodovulum sp. PH10]EJW13289.1 Putative oxidoreductase, Fe-S subunit [Rhodovulum sp. PH10]
MDAETKNQLDFPVVGRTAANTPAMPQRPLRPALLAPYRDLTTLRYDFPLVLVTAATPDGAVQSLTGIVNALLKELAPRGASGEKMRRHLLRLEQEIRRRVAAGKGGRLGAVWDDVATALCALDAEIGQSLSPARAALAVDGELADCAADTPRRVVSHLWRIACAQKRAAVVARIDALKAALSDLLAAGTLSEARAARIRTVLEHLVPPAFFADGADPAPIADDCAAARKTCRAQRAALVDLARAIAVGELERDGRYDPALHDAAIAGWSDASLGAEALALAPGVLLCLDDTGAALRGEVLDLLAAGLPVKILVTSDDLLGAPDADPPLGLSAAKLGTMAAGLEDAFVLQASAAALVRTATRIGRGLAYDGPALVAVFTGRPAAAADGLPLYLQAAAAGQARLFPTFCYDPSAGPELVARWSVADDNPQAERDWSVHPFVYENGGQRVATDLAFTPADLIACDPRFSDHVRLVAAAGWSDAMAPVDAVLNEAAGADAVPFVPVVDATDRLFRAIPSKAVIAASARCRDAWHALQEMGGIGNSWADKKVAEEKEIWDEERQMLVLAAKAHETAAS